MDTSSNLTTGLDPLFGLCREAFLNADADATLADAVGRQLNQLNLPELIYCFNKLLQFDTPVAITGLTATLGPRHACELFLRNHLIPVLYQDEAVVAKIMASPTPTPCQPSTPPKRCAPQQPLFWRGLNAALKGWRFAFTRRKSHM